MKKEGVLKLVLTMLLFLTACVSASTTAGTASSDPIIPTIKAPNWFVDTTGRVSADTLDALNAEAEAFNREGFQLAGAIFLNSSSDGLEIATKFINDQGIGSAQKDNGIVIVVFLDKEGGSGEKPAISVGIGSGLEALLNDAKVGRFLDETFVPARKDGNWEQGVVQFVQLVHRYLQNPEAEEFKTPPPNLSWLWWCLGLFVVYLLVDLIFFRFQITAAVLSAAAEVSSSSSSSTSGGGSSGGGGGSSGGGASR
jgi:uncharacterized protein